MSRSSDVAGRPRRPGQRTITTLDEMSAAFPVRHGDVLALPADVLHPQRQQRLNAQLAECGCTAGERGAAHGLVLAAVVCLARRGSARPGPLLAIGGFCGAGMGKWLGRRRALRAATRSLGDVVGVGRRTA